MHGAGNDDGSTTTLEPRTCCVCGRLMMQERQPMRSGVAPPSPHSQAADDSETEPASAAPSRFRDATLLVVIVGAQTVWVALLGYGIYRLLT